MTVHSVCNRDGMQWADCLRQLCMRWTWTASLQWNLGQSLQQILAARACNIWFEKHAQLQQCISNRKFMICYVTNLQLAQYEISVNIYLRSIIVSKTSYFVLFIWLLNSHLSDMDKNDLIVGTATVDRVQFVMTGCLLPYGPEGHPRYLGDD